MIRKTTKNKLIVILGPTASGKSGLAIKLAQKFNGYITSADSRQIYQEMDIGTNKEPGKWREGIYYVSSVPHFLIDIVKPNQDFSLSQYQKEVFRITKRKPLSDRVPFLVGGTGLYIQAIVDNLDIPKTKPNQALRKKLESETTRELAAQLEQLDPAALLSIDVNNKRRLVRALEVCLTTNKAFSSQQKKRPPIFDVLQIGLDTPREQLYQKINQRVDQMIKQGLVDEVKKLSKKYSWDLPAMSGIGYKQIGMYLRGEISKYEAINLIKRDTRHYAKRQMTWFRRDGRIRWVGDYEEARKLVGGFLNNKLQNISSK